MPNDPVKLSKMRKMQRAKILVVTPDAVTLQIVIGVVATRCDADVSIATSGSEALDIECEEQHHVVVTMESLPDMSGFDFIGRILGLRNRPVILISDSPQPDQMVRALRIGVLDVLSEPVDADRLQAAVERGLRQDIRERRRQQREQRYRSLLRQVLRDRRELHQRMDLICRDMVGAHRRLFHRVLCDEQGSRKRI